MTKLILSTSNIISTAPSIIRRTQEKSNIELVSALRANLEAAQRQPTNPTTNGNSNGTTIPDYKSWTTTSTEDPDTLFLPTHNFTATGLQEEHASYEITVKLFFLPNKPASCRCAQTRVAINLVLQELHVPHIDLLIVSFPGIAFDAEDEDGEEHAHEADAAAQAEDVATLIETWECLEEFHDKGVIKRLGVSEFGKERLGSFLAKARVRPGVDQINVRDCCVVPRDLILFAKKEGVELLTHNDCTDILPRGTLRDMLGSGKGGMGVVAGEEGKGMQGEVEPQWVIKYTAVVKDRGVIENKGYFAMAEVVR